MSIQSLHVTSETGHLKEVIVHTPGAEMALVSPDNLDELLFEDILFVGHAREEHLVMRSVFEKVIGGPGGVLEIADLLLTAFEDEDGRGAFVEQICAVMPERNLQAFAKDLISLGPKDLAHFALTGVSPLAIYAQPLPNLLFTRDVAAVVGDSLVLSHPATAARARESIIMNIVVSHHPRFAAHREKVIRLPRGVTFEGGDLLVASETAVVVGCSERTSFGGVVSLARALFARTAIEDVIVVNLPQQRSCMHLDTVFTFAEPGLCVAYPPIIEAVGQNNVLRLRAGEADAKLNCEVYDGLKSALEDVMSRPFTFVSCGGGDPLNQQREQWTDGANFFALAPGVIIGYERNNRTFEEMSKHGYRVVSAESFLDYHDESEFDPSQKLAIKLEGNELSRGRGGPRCMTMPLARA
ncbi:MAG: arginine deiminase [Rhodothermales bacterium]|jgi:arginine deiminase